jgi:hypothetical protein
MLKALALASAVLLASGVAAAQSVELNDAFPLNAAAKAQLATEQAVQSTAKVHASTGINYNQLDHGVWWFSNSTEALKQQPGQTNANFNRSKDTFIYIHGWQKGSTRNQARETFQRDKMGVPGVDITQAWRNKNWNVGICYWNQFADEDEVKDAEAKIWSANGPRQMRWRNAAGNYTAGPAKSAAQLCYESIREALRGYQGGNVRLAGHSLGSQMVIAVTALMRDGADRGEIPANAVPKRVALLDHAFLKDARPYLNNRWTGEVARDIVTNLKSRGIMFEAYRSSGSTSNGFIGDANNGLNKMVAFTELSSPYFGSFDFSNKHEHAVWHYIWSMSFAAPRPFAEPGSTPLHPANVFAQAASAATDDYRINAQMNSALKWITHTGQDTRSPGDDVFKLANK